MCLAIPGKVVEIRGTIGIVDFQGIRRKVRLDLLDEVKVGDWVMVHVGFAISRIGEEEAKSTLELMKQLTEL